MNSIEHRKLQKKLKQQNQAYRNYKKTMERRIVWCMGWTGIICPRQVPKGRFMCHKCWEFVPAEMREHTGSYQFELALQRLDEDIMREELCRK